MVNSKVHSLERTRRCSGLLTVTVLQWWIKSYRVDGVAKLQPSVACSGVHTSHIFGTALSYIIGLPAVQAHACRSTRPTSSWCFFDFSTVLGVTFLPFGADRFFLLFFANDLLGFFPLSFLASDFCVASEIKDTCSSLATLKLVIFAFLSTPFWSLMSKNEEQPGLLLLLSPPGCPIAPSTGSCISAPSVRWRLPHCSVRCPDNHPRTSTPPDRRHIFSASCPVTSRINESGVILAWGSFTSPDNRRDRT